MTQIKGGRTGAFIRSGRDDNETQVKRIKAESAVTEAGNMTGHGEKRQDKCHQTGNVSCKR